MDVVVVEGAVVVQGTLARGRVAGGHVICEGTRRGKDVANI